MYFIKKGKKVVATNNPAEVTKENFVVEPGGENRVWCKLELYEYDKVSGDKIALRNQIMGENPSDFEMMCPVWKREGMTVTMLHDPRKQMSDGGVEDKLAKLNAQLEEAEKAEAEAAAKAEAEAAAKAKAEAEAAAKAKAEAAAKAEEEKKTQDKSNK